MSQVRFSPRSIAIGLALTALLAMILTVALVAVAQEPAGDGEPGRSPDRITAIRDASPVPDPAAPNATSYFVFLSANTFVPYDDDMTYTYGGSGCMHRTGGASFMDHSLVLPQGAEITQVRLYYYDSDPTNNPELQLYAFPGNGTYQTIVDLEREGTPGQTWLDSAPFSHIVDNSAEALALRLDYQFGTSDSLEICGVRIRYQYSPSISTLPLVLNGAGP